MIFATCIRSNSGQSIASAPRLQPSAADWFPYQVMDMPLKWRNWAAGASPDLEILQVAKTG